jgi:hypothetical protein
VTSSDKRLLGKYSKQGMNNLQDVARELFTDADKFVMKFESHADVKSKAAMIGVLLFLDYLFFEDEGNVNLASQTVKCCDCYFCGSTIPFKLSLANNQ